MNNKIFYGIIVAIVLVFGGVFYFMSQKEETPENLSDSGYYPYTDKEPNELQGPTKDMLDDKNYQFNLTPDEANKKIEMVKKYSYTYGVLYVSIVKKQRHYL